MKLSPFLKEHKQNLKKLTKKQLIQQVLNWIDISAHIEAQFNDTYEALDNKYQVCEAELIRTEKELKMFESLFESEQVTADILAGSLQSAENAIRMYENMSVIQFIKSKYAK